MIDDNLVVGGTFKQIDGQERLRIAAFDADDELLPRAEPAGGDVSTVVPVGGYVYVGGAFSRHRRHRPPQPRRARRRRQPAAVGLNPDDTVYTLLKDGPRVAVGGAFTTIAGQPRRSLAAFDTGGTLLDRAPQVDGGVYSLLADDDAVFAGGWFRSGRQRDAQRPRRLRPRRDGRLLPWTADVGGLDRGSVTGVRALAVLDGALYLGGSSPASTASTAPASPPST